MEGTATSPERPAGTRYPDAGRGGGNVAGGSAAAPPQLFCLPQAGASATRYVAWRRRLAPTARVCPVELPGRGSRWGEVPPDRLSTLVDDLARRIRTELDGPYVLYGHSFGALLAYELAHALRPLVGEPEALLVSGRNGPSLPHPAMPLHGLPKDRLLERLRELGGVPDSLERRPEALDPFLPTLRADARLAELYQRGRHAVLTCPLYVVAGDEDPLADPAGLARWGEETTADCEVTRVRAGHTLFDTGAFHDWLRRALTPGGD
ncbi:thioesterase II family protein [Streptomyces sp. AJS327]|uniref:thioesterase II family protein n=1 Tax=Streptomyces sp. AJS327 TaxID=2545265 RepID=UPI0015DF07C5|nr:alpha/beta fold hydrolase [Streptomyces sp. AJS327]